MTSLEEVADEWDRRGKAVIAFCAGDQFSLGMGRALSACAKELRETLSPSVVHKRITRHNCSCGWEGDYLPTHMRDMKSSESKKQTV